MSNEPNGFAKYLVIFVDILGSQNRVDFQETYKINKIFHEELERNKQNDMIHTVYFRKIYTFSDCAYIFYGFKDGISDERKDEGELFKVALCNCEPIFLRFIKERILFIDIFFINILFNDSLTCSWHFRNQSRPQNRYIFRVFCNYFIFY